jgi:hypothetical protein
MPLDTRALNSVVRISSAGSFAGTGSIISVPSEANPRAGWSYVVTAHHVIAAAGKILIEIEVPDPLAEGRRLFPPVECDDWRQPLPGVDLAISPLPTELVPRHQSASFREFIPEDTIVPLGGEIIYLGIFAPLGIPMARAAILGTQGVPIKQPGYTYMGDLVDCRSYSGFSGSPCFSLMSFATDDPPRFAEVERPRRPDGSIIALNPISTLALFCGIFTAHFSDEKAADGVVSRYGVGVMLPSQYIREALMTDDAKNERREWDTTREARERRELPPLENVQADNEQVRALRARAAQACHHTEAQG